MHKPTIQKQPNQTRSLAVPVPTQVKQQCFKWLLAALASGLIVLVIGSSLAAQQQFDEQENSNRMPPPMPKRKMPSADRSYPPAQKAQWDRSAQTQSGEIQATPSSGPINHVGQGHVDLEFCRVLLISKVDVPAQESGPLVALPVVEGQAVQANQLLANIDDQVAKLRLETAQTKYEAANEKAVNDIDIRAANNALQLAERERRRNYSLYQKGTLPKAEYDRSALQAKQAALQLEQAQRDRQAAMREAQVESYNVKATDESIKRHVISSPIDGVVMELYEQAGEWVNAGDNVIRLARMDRLHVQGFLDSTLFNPHEIQGKPVTISVLVARGQSIEFTGKIVFVSFEKANANAFVVRAEVENRQENGRWMLLANEEATMRIHVGETAVQANAWQGSGLRR